MRTHVEAIIPGHSTCCWGKIGHCPDAIIIAHIIPTIEANANAVDRIVDTDLNLHAVLSSPGAYFRQV